VARELQRERGSWWDHWNRWIEEHTPDPRPAPRRLGSDSYPPLGDAPGDYVRRVLTKHGAVAYAQWLSATYRHRGVVVQAICPQGVRTRMLEAAGPLQELLSHDVALEPEDIAEATWQALQDNRFLVLPHPQVAEYYRQRAADPDRWLAGMNKLQRRIEDHG
jgi:NAD(P)-dependent dehydrogenase (short-subunit alcohol dehydrogenase family)